MTVSCIKKLSITDKQTQTLWGNSCYRWCLWGHILPRWQTPSTILAITLVSIIAPGKYWPMFKTHRTSGSGHVGSVLLWATGDNILPTLVCVRCEHHISVETHYMKLSTSALKRKMLKNETQSSRSTWKAVSHVTHRGAGQHPVVPVLFDPFHCH